MFHSACLSEPDGCPKCGRSLQAQAEREAAQRRAQVKRALRWRALGQVAVGLALIAIGAFWIQAAIRRGEVELALFLLPSFGILTFVDAVRELIQRPRG